MKQYFYITACMVVSFASTFPMELPAPADNQQKAPACALSPLYFTVVPRPLAGEGSQKLNLAVVSKRVEANFKKYNALANNPQNILLLYKKLGKKDLDQLSGLIIASYYHASAELFDAALSVFAQKILKEYFQECKSSSQFLDRFEFSDSLKKEIVRKIIVISGCMPWVNDFFLASDTTVHELYKDAPKTVFSEAHFSFSADSLLLATAVTKKQREADKEILVTQACLWELPTYRLLATLEVDSTKAGVSGLATCFSMYGIFLVIGQGDGTLELWNIKSGTCSAVVMSGHKQPIHSFKLSSNGIMLATVSSDVSYLWNIHTGKRLCELDGQLDANICFSADSLYCAVEKPKAQIDLYDLKKNKCIRTFRDYLLPFTPRIYSLCFNHAGTVLAVGYSNGNIVLWDTATGNQIRTLKLEKPAEIKGIELYFNPSDTLLLSCAAASVVQLWDIDSGKCIKIFEDKVGWQGTHGFFTPYGIFCGVFSYAHNAFELRDLSKFNCVKKFTVGDIKPLLAQISPDGSLFVTYTGTNFYVYPVLDAALREALYNKLTFHQALLLISFYQALHAHSKVSLENKAHLHRAYEAFDERLKSYFKKYLVVHEDTGLDCVSM